VEIDCFQNARNRHARRRTRGTRKCWSRSSHQDLLPSRHPLNCCHVSRGSACFDRIESSISQCMPRGRVKTLRSHTLLQLVFDDGQGKTMISRGSHENLMNSPVCHESLSLVVAAAESELRTKSKFITQFIDSDSIEQLTFTVCSDDGRISPPMALLLTIAFIGMVQWWRSLGQCGVDVDAAPSIDQVSAQPVFNIIIAIIR